MVLESGRNGVLRKPRRPYTKSMKRGSLPLFFVIILMAVASVDATTITDIATGTGEPEDGIPGEIDRR
jgi:hypothetical protein